MSLSDAIQNQRRLKPATTPCVVGQWLAAESRETQDEFQEYLDTKPGTQLTLYRACLAEGLRCAPSTFARHYSDACGCVKRDV